MIVALCAARKFGVKMDSLHLDSSSFHVDGNYINNGKANVAEPGGIEITYGYSPLNESGDAEREQRLVEKEGGKLRSTVLPNHSAYPPKLGS